MTTDSRTDPTAAEIPFREVRMIRRNLDDIPQFGWPDGFSSRRFADGDMDVWASIISTDKHLEADRALFVREFGEDIRRIAERMFFVVSPDGKVVGTSTAWEDRDDHGVTVGRVHWVFLLPEYHGQGLACQADAALGIRINNASCPEWAASQTRLKLAPFHTAPRV
ncbi:MAG: GNAT family N-acetyltransferase [Verrucomicrobiae bacterium]